MHVQILSLTMEMRERKNIQKINTIKSNQILFALLVCADAVHSSTHFHSFNSFICSFISKNRLGYALVY